MSKYVATVVLRDGNRYSWSHDDFTSACRDAAELKRRFGSNPVLVERPDRVDFGCSDGLSEAEREMLPEGVG
jgi:hypothetical protein